MAATKLGGHAPHPGNALIWGLSATSTRTPSHSGVATKPSRFALGTPRSVAISTPTIGSISSRTSGSSIDEAYPPIVAVIAPSPSLPTRSTGSVNQNGVS